MTEIIPKTILEKYPQMPIVFEAIRQFRSNEAVTAKCPKCGTVTVNEIKELGVIEVNCNCGFLHYREKHGVF